MRPFRSFQRRSRACEASCLVRAPFPNRAWELTSLPPHRLSLQANAEIAVAHPTQMPSCRVRRERYTDPSRQRMCPPHSSSCWVIACMPMSDSTSCRATSCDCAHSNISIIPTRDAFYTSPRARCLIRKRTLARARQLTPPHRLYTDWTRFTVDEGKMRVMEYSRVRFCVYFRADSKCEHPSESSCLVPATRSVQSVRTYGPPAAAPLDP